MTAPMADTAAQSRPAVPQTRPRVVLIGTTWVVAGIAVLFAGLFSVYFAARADFGPGWIPDGAGTIPLTPASVMLVTLVMSSVTVQWGVWAVGRDDRLHTYVANGLSLVLAAAFLNQASFLYTAMGWEITGSDALQAVLIYAITGSQLVMLAAAMAFLLLTTLRLRAVGGRYSSRDREGAAAAALFWHASVAAYAVIWTAIYQIK